MACVLFANRIYKANGTEFQKFFASVQRGIHGTGFINVRPDGNLGDGGNDGYIQATGHYYQVYGPVEPEDKVATAVEKLTADFGKLKKHWDQHSPIRAYSFVFNDKYEGVFTRLAQALQKLANDHKIPCEPYSIAHMEDDFMKLSQDKMQSVLGQLIPDASRVTEVDFGVLNEVIVHIMNIPARSVPSRLGELPDLDEKIRLNNLCAGYAVLLNNAARRGGRVDAFFAKNSTFQKEELQKRMIGSYQ
ncbi:MAG: hypothetical protein ACRCZF_07210, partial [Gemmataceae bacterium]